MKSRCVNRNDPAYYKYGGRGITICERWLKFEDFLTDMGDRPEGLSLDRIDNNGNYEPGNCRWATRKEQANNRRNSLKITFNHKTQTLAQWSQELNIKFTTLWARINKHKWSVEKAFTTPVK